MPVSFSMFLSSSFSRSSCKIPRQTTLLPIQIFATALICEFKEGKQKWHLAGREEAGNIYERRVLLWQQVWPVHALQASAGS